MEKSKSMGGRMVGIISDTHDNIYLIDKAVEVFNELDISLVLHSGDYISPFTVGHFKKLKAKLIGVFGNNCAERSLLTERFKEINADVKGFFVEVKVNGVKIALLHGHEVDLLISIVSSAAYDVVVHGHTHEAEVRHVGKTLVINPGEVCGYLSGKCTVAILDSESMKVEIVRIQA